MRNVEYEEWIVALVAGVGICWAGILYLNHKINVLKTDKQ